MAPEQFLSHERMSRIEPAQFLAYMLPHYDAESADNKMRPVVLLTFIPVLQRRLLRQLDEPRRQPHPILWQSWYNPEGRSFSAISSPVGAPMAVMLLEQLIALGARQLLYLGFCGALDPTLAIGDLFVPLLAVREEGTSYHYLPAGVVPTAARSITSRIQIESEKQGLAVREGRHWTTDAPFRETASKIEDFQSSGVQAVDMEVSALLSVAAYRGCDVAALLVVSDECYHPTWCPGFRTPEMQRGCREAVSIGVAVADSLSPR